MTVNEIVDSVVTPTIPEWFAGKCIFITGATGFMGKVLVEKLLRDCPDIKLLYLLIRSKKGIEPNQRRDEYIHHMIFDDIRKNNPNNLDKIKTIKGDVSLDGLGISDIDKKQLIENVSVIFHCAANVRFDQHLKDAVNLNTMGTFRTLKLAEQIHNFKAFVHVSTAYCQCNEEIVEERGYAPPHSPLGITKMTELLDNEILDYITPKLLKGLPNTYAYTKALTENLITNFDKKLPIVITRPSIVAAAWQQPFPGWVEGLNGPTGLMIGAARGVLRSMHCNPDLGADIIPVDTSINAIIIAAWKRGLQEDKNIEYINITTPQELQMTWGESIEKGRKLFYENPLCFSLWYPDGSIKANYWHHWLCVIFFHYLPAYFIDLMFVIFRSKPFLVRTQKRISQGLEVLQYYTTKNWIFKNDNFIGLQNEMHPDDRITFNVSMNEIDWDAYLNNYILGARHFLLKEKPETLPKARTLLRRLYLLDKLVSFLLYGLIIWCIYLNWSNIQYGFEAVIDGTKGLLKNRGRSVIV